MALAPSFVNRFRISLLHMIVQTPAEDKSKLGLTQTNTGYLREG